MTGEELQDAIRKLREFAVAQGMQWALDEVDEAIALGVPETRTLRQTTRQGVTTYEDVTAPDALPFPGLGRGRRTGHSAEFIRTRPMTQQEQAQLLVQALNRVLADLDVVAVGSLKALNPETLSDHVDGDSEMGFPIPHVSSISFVPDEGSTAPAVSIDVILSSQRHAQVAGLLSEIQAELDS